MFTIYSPFPLSRLKVFPAALHHVRNVLRFMCVGNHLTVFIEHSMRVIKVMELNSFFYECYEILAAERPLLLMEVADLVAAGTSPIEVSRHVDRMIQNPGSAIPALAENTAHYLVGLIPAAPESLNSTH